IKPLFQFELRCDVSSDSCASLAALIARLQIEGRVDSGDAGHNGWRRKMPAIGYMMSYLAKDYDIMTRSPLSTPIQLLGFLEMGSWPMSHIYNEGDRSQPQTHMVASVG